MKVVYNLIQKYKIANIEFSEMEDSTSYKKKILQDLFRKVRIRAFASGSNAHTLPVDINVLKRGADTIYNQPILWRYNPYLDDAMGHETDEVPCGFVPESDNNPIRYEEDNNKTYLVIDALLWAKYCGKLIEIFERDGGTKDVSIEMNCEILEHPDGDEIIDYVASGITILGEWVNPAVEGCRAEMLQFSKDKDEFLNLYNFAKDAITINNSKENSVKGKWENPRRKLFRPIISASNTKSLLSEAYLISNLENPTMSNCKYPHHVVKNNNLVLHVDGLQAAFARAKQQNIFEGNIKKHITRHYNELGLSKENFAEFGFSEEDYNIYFNESDGENIMDSKNKNTTVNDDKNKNMAEGANQESSNTEGEDKEKKYAEMESKCSELECKCAELEKKCSKLEEDNRAYMAKCEAMSDYEELKQFKYSTEEKQKQEENMAKMNEVFSQIAEKGFSLSEDVKKQIEQKFAEFDNVDAWTNYAKAFALDNAEKENRFNGIAYPESTKKSDFGGLWDDIV